MRVALVSRDLAPFAGGGIAEYIASTARMLADVAEVTVITSAAHESAYRELSARRDARALPRHVSVEFVPEPTPGDLRGFFNHMHRYSAAVYDRLKAVYAGGGPDILEFSDYLAEGFVAVQARDALDPFLNRTEVCIRLHTTLEMCAVLDGFLANDLAARTICAMERFTLEHADRLLWPGGDVLETYRRFYGAGRLAPASLARNPFETGDETEIVETPGPVDAPLRMLYLGRLERRKGVRNLVHAALGLSRSDWQLTLLGGDTDTGPLGSSMRAQIEMVTAEDPRIVLHAPVPRDQLGALISRHDVVVLPSLWECWPYVGLEAMRLGRPLVATPTGGFTEIVRHGENGWLARGTTSEALAEVLEEVLAARPALHAMTAARAPQKTVRELSAPAPIQARYRELADGVERREDSVGPSSTPLVSVVVPYYRLSAYVEDTVRSIYAQTYGRLEVIIVNDGSFEAADDVLRELWARYPVTVLSQPNRGLGAARNFGIRQSRGRYVFPLDADNLAEPGFIERCVSLLERRPHADFATSWSRYVDDLGRPLPPGDVGYQPMGNWTPVVEHDNVAGDAAAVLRRRIFDAGFWYSEELTSFEDWNLYVDLHRAGRFGVVIPERLLRYRVRGDSMIREIGLPYTGRLHDEMRAMRREREMQWTSRSD